MKMKKLAVLLALVLCTALISGCAYLPTLGISAMYTGTVSSTQPTDAPVVTGPAPAVTAAPADDTVVISREQYEKYQQFDELLEIMH